MQNFSLNQIKVTGGFLSKRLDLNRTATIPSVYEQFKQSGRIDALKCIGMSKDVHIYWDSDVYKWLEAAVYLLARYDDAEIRKRYNAIVDDIVMHQRADGYFNSYFLTCHQDEIFQCRGNHELYCAGHLFEAAVASAQYLHDERLLAVSEKFADYIQSRFMIKKDTAFTTPGHEEIELALWRLYEYTGDKQYKIMSEFFLTERGKKQEENDPRVLQATQSHARIYEQDKAVGHSVRALYLYTAMADMARINGDEKLAATVKTLYDDIVDRRMYVTGGIGSAYEGERFASDYFLPNGRAYSETCASIALMLFCDRMIRLTGEKKYADTLERAFYNCVLACVSLDGDKFFYINPLEVKIADINDNKAYSARMPFPLAERVKIFYCSCCPPNLARIVEQFSSYAFYCHENTLAIEQFVDASLSSGIADVEMKTDIPYKGKVNIKVNSHGKKLTLKVRVPDWCDKKFDEEIDGYLIYTGIFDDKIIEMDFAPTLKKVYSNPNIEDDFGKVCFTYGPLILCAENIDNKFISGVSVDDISDATIDVTYDDYAVKISVPATHYNGSELYGYNLPPKESIRLNLIPYFAHANRGETDMKVWFVEL